MSYCKEEGKDKVIFLVAEDLAAPSTVTLSADEDPPGLILPSGEINWSCPCLGGMAVGPCGVEFREAFSCFHFSKEDSKGSDCFDKFKSMQECMKNYPTVYGKDEDRVEEEREEARAESGEEKRTAEAARPSS